MSNKCDFGAHLSPTGWIAWYRLYHHGENKVLRHGKDDILFSTKAEAEAAAKDKFLSEMNSDIVSEALTGPTTKKGLARAQLEKMFSKGKVIEVERKGAAA